MKGVAFITFSPKKLRILQCIVEESKFEVLASIMKAWKCEDDSYKASPHSTNEIRRSNEEEEITEDSLTINVKKGELRVCMNNGSINLFEPMYQATLPGS